MKAQTSMLRKRKVYVTKAQLTNCYRLGLSDTVHVYNANVVINIAVQVQCTLVTGKRLLMCDVFKYRQSL
jgi:hypothetical protein